MDPATEEYEMAKIYEGQAVEAIEAAEQAGEDNDPLERANQLRLAQVYATLAQTYATHYLGSVTGSDR